MAVRSSSRRDDEDALDPVEAADEGGVDDVDEFTADALIEGEDPFDDDSEEDLETNVEELPEEPAPSLDDDGEGPIVLVDEDEEIDGVRDGEFVCRGCYMAKRETQLADADRLLCRDCA